MFDSATEPGPWDAATAYAREDAVFHGGTYWITRSRTSAGEEPGVDPEWRLLTLQELWRVSKRQDPPALPFDPARDYSLGDLAWDGDGLYGTRADVAASATTPSADTTNWVRINEPVEPPALDFDNTRDYVEGEFAWEATFLYRAMRAVPASAVYPSGDPTNWEPVGVNNPVALPFDPTYEYEEGNLAWDNVHDELYVAITNVGVTTTAPSEDRTNWRPVGIVPYTNRAGLVLMSTKTGQPTWHRTETPVAGTVAAVPKVPWGVSWDQLEAFSAFDPNSAQAFTGDWTRVAGAGSLAAGAMVILPDYLYLSTTDANGANIDPRGVLNAGDIVRLIDSADSDKWAEFAVSSEWRKLGDGSPREVWSANVHAKSTGPNGAPSVGDTVSISFAPSPPAIVPESMWVVDEVHTLAATVPGIGGQTVEPGQIIKAIDTTGDGQADSYTIMGHSGHKVWEQLSTQPLDAAAKVGDVFFDRDTHAVGTIIGSLAPTYDPNAPASKVYWNQADIAANWGTGVWVGTAPPTATAGPSLYGHAHSQTSGAGHVEADAARWAAYTTFVDHLVPFGWTPSVGTVAIAYDPATGIANFVDNAGEWPQGTLNAVDYRVAINHDGTNTIPFQVAPLIPAGTTIRGPVLDEKMIREWITESSLFEGTLGDVGTALAHSTGYDTLDPADATNKGHTYLAAEAFTTVAGHELPTGVTVNPGDSIVSDGTNWEIIAGGGLTQQQADSRYLRWVADLAYTVPPVSADGMILTSTGAGTAQARGVWQDATPVTAISVATTGETPANTQYFTNNNVTPEAGAIFVNTTDGLSWMFAEPFPAGALAWVELGSGGGDVERIVAYTGANADIPIPLDWTKYHAFDINIETGGSPLVMSQASATSRKFQGTQISSEGTISKFRIDMPANNGDRQFAPQAGDKTLHIHCQDGGNYGQFTMTVEAAKNGEQITVNGYCEINSNVSSLTVKASASPTAITVTGVRK